MTLKLNIGDTKSGKTIQKELDAGQSKALSGKKLTDKFSGSSIGFSGYEFEITGGSDNAGFPMRRDVQGTGRKKILATKGVGFRTKRKGERQRITVAGNTVYAGTAQLNVKVVKHGKDSLFEEPKEEAADAGEEKKEDTPKPEESKKEESKESEKPKEESKSDDKKSDDKKEESKESDSKDEKKPESEAKEEPKKDEGDSKKDSEKKE